MCSSRRKPTIHTGSSGSCAAVFLSRGVPLPADEPRTTGPDLIFCGPATLLGFVHPSQYSSPVDPGVFHRGICLPRRFSAVHPHMPLSTIHFAPLIFTGVDRRFQNSFPEAEVRSTANDQTGSWVLLPRASRSPYRAVLRHNPAMGF